MLILTIILFIAILSVLVLVHELGHFLVARRNGVYSEEFGLGYPPRLCGWYKSSETGKWRFFWFNNCQKRKDINDTIYSINFIPLGGFTKLLGEDEEIKSSKSFSEKSSKIRLKIIIAGVVFNFFFAWLLFSCWLWVAPSNIDNQVIVIGTNEKSAAAEAGIKQNDFITKVNGKKLENADQLSEFTDENKGKEVAITIKRYNKETDYNLYLKDEEHPLGISMVNTGGEIPKFKWYIVPIAALEEMGLVIWTSASFLFSFIASIFTDVKAPTEAVSGPVGIFSFLYQIISFGWLYVIRFMALLSLALAFFNILPFPALDGGRLVFIISEMIFKKKIIKEKIESMIHLGGFALLIILIIVVTYNDIVKLIAG